MIQYASRSRFAAAMLLGLSFAALPLAGCVNTAQTTKSEAPRGTLMNQPSTATAAPAIRSTPAPTTPAPTTPAPTAAPAPEEMAVASRINPPTVSAAAAAAKFDYYLLALTWTPEFCATSRNAKDKPDCAPDQRRGLSVHGLWPQFDRGGYPEFCVKPAAAIPADVLQAMQRIMPDEGLIKHEWAKHGTCSGETPDDYFADTWASWERLAVPEELRDPPEGFTAPASAVRDALLAANPLLRPDSVVLSCRRGHLTEVRICLDKALESRTCGAKVVDSCGPNDVLDTH